MTVNEAAEALQISRAKVYDLLLSGKLESIRIGSLRRIPRDRLVPFIEREIEPTAVRP
jgi:excisionase family DNA binding protein